MKLVRDILSEQQCSIAKQCLLAACEGPFFYDCDADDPWWEFSILLGLAHSELSAIAVTFPDGDDVSIKLILGVIGNLLGYPHGHHDDEEWKKHIDLSSEQLSQVFDELRRAKVKDTEQ